jgi:Flp pilus assembly protein TadD
VTTLGNLASAQVELGRYADAEKSVTKALSLDPEDFFSLYVLGRIRFRENKMDEALNALSRSAQSNPDYADAQNYLGIVLSEKGQRGPAEAALRRAIQLQPNNAVAHNNLAVVYATQTPPALALARWHYQKARDGGHPRNAQLEKMIDIKP